MRHIVWLGIRGLLMEASAAILRVHGAFHYRRLLLQRRDRFGASLRGHIAAKKAG